MFIRVIIFQLSSVFLSTIYTSIERDHKENESKQVPKTIIKSISIEPLEPESENISGNYSAEKSIDLNAKDISLALGADAGGKYDLEALLRSFNKKINNYQDSSKKQKWCYVASYKTKKDDDEFIDYLNQEGATILKRYENYAKGVYFCLSDPGKVKDIRSHYLLNYLERDQQYSIASKNNFLYNSKLQFSKYSDSFLKTQLYKTFLFKYLPNKEYYSTSLEEIGENNIKEDVLDIYIVSTTVDTDLFGIKDIAINIYKNKSACNFHSTILSTVISGIESGFSRKSKKSKIKVLNVVDCNGNINLSELIEALDGLKFSKVKRSILLFGISGPVSNILNDLVSNIIQLGVIVITSVGDNGDFACKYSPGSSLGTINVGSVNKLAKLSRFTNHGECVSIYSLGEGVELNYTYSGHENLISGTSISAAFLANLIAIFIRKFPDSNSSQIRKFIQDNSFRFKNLYNVQKLPRLNRVSSDIFIHNPNTIYFFVEYFDTLLNFTLILLCIMLLVYFYSKRSRNRDENKNFLMAPPIKRDNEVYTIDNQNEL